jgi:hypothetical protein
MEKFHFLFHLEAKTNKRREAFAAFSFVSIVGKWKQTAEKSSSRSFCLNKKSRENKISMETTPMKKKEGEKIWNVFHLRQYFFSSFVSRGGFILSQVGKSVFHIKIIFAWRFFFFLCVQSNNEIVISSATDDVSQMCGIPWSILLSSWERDEEKQSRGDDSESIWSY